MYSLEPELKANGRKKKKHQIDLHFGSQVKGAQSRPALELKVATKFARLGASKDTKQTPQISFCRNKWLCSHRVVARDVVIMAAGFMMKPAVSSKKVGECSLRGRAMTTRFASPWALAGMFKFSAGIQDFH